MRSKISLLFFIGLFLIIPAKIKAQEKFHLFFLEKLEGNLVLFFKKDLINGYKPKNEIFHYQVFYSGMLVGECLIKYKINNGKFEAEFSSNTVILPKKAIAKINLETLLPEKIEVIENNNLKKEIIYDQKNFSIISEKTLKKLFYPIIEPITMACIFRTFDLSEGKANFLFGEKETIFHFDLSKRKKIKITPKLEAYQYLSEPPKIILYLSDDEKKLPLGIIYELFVGKLELKLKKYRSD